MRVKKNSRMQMRNARHFKPFRQYKNTPTETGLFHPK
jgi:hypothetical protein